MDFFFFITSLIGAKEIQEEPGKWRFTETFLTLTASSPGEGSWTWCNQSAGVAGRQQEWLGCPITRWYEQKVAGIVRQPHSRDKRGSSPSLRPPPSHRYPLLKHHLISCRVDFPWGSNVLPPRSFAWLNSSYTDHFFLFIFFLLILLYKFLLLYFISSSGFHRWSIAFLSDWNLCPRLHCVCSELLLLMLPKNVDNPTRCS